jgi:hypothetical protein
MTIELRRRSRTGQSNADVASEVRLFVDGIRGMCRDGLLHFQSAT